MAGRGDGQSQLATHLGARGHARSNRRGKCQSNSSSRIEEESRALVGPEGSSDIVTASRPISFPVSFVNDVTLLRYSAPRLRTPVDGEVVLVAYWKAPGPIYDPLASFVHLVDAEGRLLGQYDGLDVFPWEWQEGERFVQAYRFPVDREATPGAHWLQIGLYNSSTLERLPVVREDIPLGDHLQLRRMELTP